MRDILVQWSSEQPLPVSGRPEFLRVAKLTSLVRSYTNDEDIDCVQEISEETIQQVLDEMWLQKSQGWSTGAERQSRVAGQHRHFVWRLAPTISSASGDRLEEREHELRAQPPKERLAIQGKKVW